MQPHVYQHAGQSDLQSSRASSLRRYGHLSCSLLIAIMIALGACDDEEGTDNTSDNVNAEAGTEVMDSTPPFVPNPDGYLTRVLIDDQASGPAFAEVQDMNGDGKLDLIVSKFGSIDNYVIEPGQITIYYQGASLEDWTQEDIVSDEEPSIGLTALRSQTSMMMETWTSR